MSRFHSSQLASLALIALTTAACSTSLASPSASPPASPTGSPPIRLQFTDDDGETVTIDFDDQSGLLVEATKGEPFEAAPGEDLSDDGILFLNAASDVSVLRVEWAAPAGCAASYSMTIDATARKLEIQVPPPSSDSIGGNCDVSLRFAEPVPAEDVEGVLVPRG